MWKNVNGELIHITDSSRVKFRTNISKNILEKLEDLAEKLQMMCDDNELVEKVRDGVDEFILNKYRWQDVAEATCKLYKK